MTHKHEAALQHLKDLQDDLTHSWTSKVQQLEANDATLELADLNYTSLGYKGAKALAKALKKNTVVTELKLGGNEIGDAGIKRLVPALKACPQIKEVDLCFNGITDIGAGYLVELVENHPIERLIMFGNEISEELESEIAALLASDRGGGDEGEAKVAKSVSTVVKKVGSGVAAPSRSASTAVVHKKPSGSKEEAPVGLLPLSRTLSDPDSAKKKRSSSPSSKSKSKASGLSHSSAKKRTTNRDKKRKKEKTPRTPQEATVHLLEQKVAELEDSERAYMAQIAELEARLLELTSVKSPKGRSLIRSVTLALIHKDKTKKMTIAIDKPIVTQKLAATGGSMAGVYSCLVDGFSCAMKELDTTHMDEFTINSFEGEIRLLELLPRHDNIVRYLFHDHSNSKIRLFMTQYSSTLGSEIQKMQRTGKRFTKPQIASCALDIIKGVDFLHEQGIIHRDLKSDNVFVLFDERKMIKRSAIGDFDTAKRVAGKTEKAKTVLGTPAWMAPEVMRAREDGEYGFECDIYSFGMVVYELLTLRMPYEDINPMMVSMNVMNGTKPTKPDVEEEFAPLVRLYEECTELDPSQRPTAMQIKQCLALLV